MNAKIFEIIRIKLNRERIILGKKTTLDKNSPGSSKIVFISITDFQSTLNVRTEFS